MKSKQRRILLTAALALAATALWAEEPAPCVVVEQTDGTRTEYLLTTEPRVSYDGSVVRLQSSEADVELAVADVAKVYLAESVLPTGISSSAAAGGRSVRVRLTAGGLELSGLEPGSDASAVSLDGRRLSGSRAGNDGSLLLPLSNVSGGVIVVRTSNQSFKLTLRK
ncbi:MAG: hypothetical protein IJ144_02355 [Prevotella sp.]|nr:hypothetical protein [Prevotella sp.]MBQ9186651.1 hypothetical protein [Prevotella sp.]